MEANDSNGDTLPDEENRDVVNIPIVVQKFWHNWNARRYPSTWKY